MSILEGTIQLRRDTAANWESVNPTLLTAEFGLDTTNNILKRGPGAWNSLTAKFVDLDYIIDLLNTPIRDQGTYDASSNLFPSTGGSGTAGAIEAGNQWTISVSGTLGGVAVTAPYSIVRALVNDPGQMASNWYVLPASSQVTSPASLPRSTAIASSATPSIDTNLYDCYSITALAAAVTSVTITGSPVNFQPLVIRFKDNGTSRAVTLGSSFYDAGGGVTFSTTINRTTHVACLYDSVRAKFGVLRIVASLE